MKVGRAPSGGTMNCVHNAPCPKLQCKDTGTIAAEILKDEPATVSHLMLKNSLPEGAQCTIELTRGSIFNFFENTYKLFDALHKQ